MTTSNLTSKEKGYIFNQVSMLNVKANEISSLGSYISASQEMVFESVYNEVMSVVDSNSLAYKILSNHTINRTLSDKQLWVIAFETMKNENFANRTIASYEAIERKANAKVEASKAKLKANKDASADVLQPIKSIRKLGDFGKWLNTSGNPFRKQHFSKKYTSEAVNAFLATI